MSYLVLARKWRPRGFAEVVGQEHVVRALANALEAQRLHHAYLFTGTRGVGKTTLARIFAKALNCETGLTATPCGRCNACLEIDAGRFVDLMEVDAATNTKVEEMRDLLDSAQYMPTLGRFKVYIIDEVHMLSRSAFNSMLKTLEEPPAHVKFVLATTDPQKVPITVLSRCLQFNLKQLPAALIAQHLHNVLDQEGIQAEPGALQLIGAAARGSVRDALSLLDQAIAFGAGSVLTEQVTAMLGSVDQQYLFKLLEALAANDGQAVMAEAHALMQRNVSFELALEQLAALLTRVALVQVVPQAANAAQSDAERTLKLAQRLAPEMVQLYYQIVLTGRRDLSLAPDEFGGFTMTLMRMLAFAPRDGVSVPVGSTASGASPERAPIARRAQSAADMRSPAATPQPARSAATAVPKTAPAAAPTPRPADAVVVPSVLSSNDDWITLVAALNAGGMAQMLARNCELKSFDGRRLELTVPPEHRHLLDPAYQEKLAAAIRAKLGAVRVNISVGEHSGASLAALEDQAQRALKAKAIASIEADPFVRDMVDNLDAKLIEDSIKPL
jgi:DNA polymerase-3 subunit gamma/tau